jgi:hypothetical protein
MAKKTEPYVPPHYVDADAYVADLERELAGYRNRIVELEALHVGETEGAYVDAASGAEAVEGLLEDFKPAPKPKPKAAAKK